MSKRCMLGLGLAAFTLVILLPPNVSGAYWTNRNGTASFFDWKNGQNATNLFGDPVVTANKFLFSPANFVAESYGTSQQVGDTIKVELTAHTSFYFTQIRITELGSYSITGTGEAKIEGTEFETNLANFKNKTSPLVVVPGSPITIGAGDWSGTAVIDTSAENPQWTHVQLQLNNNLTASAASSADHVLVRKNSLMIEIFPEPTTLLLLAVGLVWARRR
jgi:hypothetical protein